MLVVVFQKVVFQVVTVGGWNFQGGRALVSDFDVGGWTSNGGLEHRYYWRLGFQGGRAPASDEDAAAKRSSVCRHYGVVVGGGRFFVDRVAVL